MPVLDIPADFDAPTPPRTAQIEARQYRHFKISRYYLVPVMLLALSLPFWAPLAAPSMTNDQYNTMIAEVAGGGLVLLFLGLVHFTLSEVHRLKDAITIVAMLFTLTMLVVSSPMAGFIGRFFYGGLSAAVGG